MKTADFPYQNVQQYLDAIGVLETGTAKDIETARKVFRKLYLQQYQRHRYQRTHSNITVSFSKKEQKLLQNIASQNGKKLAGYIKQIALDYANNEPKASTLNLIELKRLLSLSYDIVEELHFEAEDSALHQSYDELLKLFNQLEILIK